MKCYREKNLYSFEGERHQLLGEKNTPRLFETSNELSSALALTQPVFVTDSEAPDTLRVVLQSSFISWHRLSVLPRGMFPQFTLLANSQYSMLKLLFAPFIFFLL